MNYTQKELERITEQIKALQLKKKKQNNEIDIQINALIKSD